MGMLSAPRNEQTSKDAVREAAQGSVGSPLSVHAGLTFHQGGTSLLRFLGRFLLLLSRYLAWPEKGKLTVDLMHAANSSKHQLLFRTPINSDNDFVWKRRAKQRVG